MEIYLNNGHSFPVPVAVADHLLGLASHDQLKVLLYVLCHANEPLSQEQIAKSCKVQPAAVEEALVFWQDEVNILNTTHSVPNVTIQDKPTSAQTMPDEQPAPKTETVQAKPVETHPTIPTTFRISSERFQITPSEIADRIRKDSALFELFQNAERYAGRPLKMAEQKSLIWMNETLDMPPEVIDVLCVCCAQLKKFAVVDMDRLAFTWHEQGIHTVEEALKDANKRTNSGVFTDQIRKMFEMSRTPTTYQQSCIDNWRLSGYSLDLIQFAYEKTRNQADDKLSFPYINTILLAWAEAGIHTVQEAQKLDEAFYQQKAQKKAKKTRPEKTKPAGSIQTDTQDASFDLADFDQLVNRF